MVQWCKGDRKSGSSMRRVESVRVYWASLDAGSDERSLDDEDDAVAEADRTSRWNQSIHSGMGVMDPKTIRLSR